MIRLYRWIYYRVWIQVKGWVLGWPTVDITITVTDSVTSRAGFGSMLIGNRERPPKPELPPVRVIREDKAKPEEGT